MVYILNSDNYCYLISSVVLLDDVSMTSFAFVYSELKHRLIEVWCRLEQSTVDMVVELINGTEDSELVCLRREGTSNIAF